MSQSASRLTLLGAFFTVAMALSSIATAQPASGGASAGGAEQGGTGAPGGGTGVPGSLQNGTSKYGIGTSSTRRTGYRRVHRHHRTK